MRTEQAKESLIKEWIVRFALNAGEALDAEALAVYMSLWVEAFDDVPYAPLREAFRRTLRTAKFWPVKVADIHEHIQKAEDAADFAEAESEWQKVSELYRTEYNPDIPRHLSRALAQLSERTRSAARGAGVFRNHCTAESLHVWAKKRFMEIFVNWKVCQRDKYLLPAGPVLDAIALAAERLGPVGRGVGQDEGNGEE